MLVVALAVAPTVWAAPEGPVLAEDGPIRHYAELSGTFLTGGAWADWIEASATVTVLRPWVFEAGLQWGAAFGGAYARVGYDVLRWDFTNRQHHGWALDIGPRLGGAIGAAYPDDGPENAVAAQGLLAVDANYWFAAHFAFNVQAQGGVMYVMGPKDKPGLQPLARVGLGIAF
jgi:hypothetical protein